MYQSVLRMALSLPVLSKPRLNGTETMVLAVLVCTLGNVEDKSVDGQLEKTTNANGYKLILVHVPSSLRF